MWAIIEKLRILANAVTKRLLNNGGLNNENKCCQIESIQCLLLLGISQYANSVVISKEIIDAKVKAHGAYYYLLTQLASG